MKQQSTITAALMRAIRQSGQSWYVICAATGVDKSALGRFMAGKQSMRLDIADRLAMHLGLRLVGDKKQTKGR